MLTRQNFVPVGSKLSVSDHIGLTFWGVAYGEVRLYNHFTNYTESKDLLLLIQSVILSELFRSGTSAQTRKYLLYSMAIENKGTAIVLFV